MPKRLPKNGKRRGKSQAVASPGVVVPHTGPVYKFRRTVRLGTALVPAAGTGYLGAYQQFSLDAISGYGEFTNLFDQYRIASVDWRISYRGTNTSVVESSVNSQIGMPRLIAVRDYDSNTAPASTASGWDDVAEYATSVRFDFGQLQQRTFKMSLKPAVPVPVYRTSFSTFAYGPRWDQWIDCDYIDVPYLGIRYVLHVPFTTTLSAGCTFDIDADVNLEFKTVR